MSRAKLYYDNVYFDSKWELAFYIKRKDSGEEIIREPIKIPYTFKGKKHFYKPDFRSDGKLYEIKGTLNKDSAWSIYPRAVLHIKNDSEKMEEFVEKLRVKHELATKNNINIIGWEEIQEYLKYCEVKYGTKQWQELFRKK